METDLEEETIEETDLEEGDTVKGGAATNSRLDYVISYETIA